MNNNKQFLVPIGEGLTAKSDSSLDIHRELNSQIVIVIEACGVELTPKDKGYKGDCPFCGVPSSLSVSAEKQVFYCRGVVVEGTLLVSSRSFMTNHLLKL